ncbi:hypothetical protein K431DRAFT_315409 [Polychaeton citri CBS 116435]|uniref:C4-dicarboxylate transporter/malic acid transport protein n=1 Tax=Polychaeton citri CBS 116435 TaxID=1314669 RepID=A0A9P4Q3U2_9PEZI|nr:hypothetical protein K431DRAFT_315409 [Polychaeton citri CBS 116435]
MSGTDRGGHIANGERQSEHPLRRSAFRALVQDFGPLWFTWCMNAGVIAELLQQCPYEFRGIKIISTIFFVFDLVAFVVFSLIFIARFAWFRREAYYEIVDNIVDLTLLPCWSIAWLTLTALVGLIVSRAHWGGHAFALVAYVMWWIAAAWNLFFLFFAFVTLIRRHKASDQRMPTTIIIPAVSVSTVAVTGGIVVSMSTGISARLAVPVIIVAFMYVGIGVLMGLILSVHLFHQLLTFGWPPAELVATLWIFIGPLGQSAAALQALGSAANTHGAFAGYNKGTFLTAQAAPALEAACMLIALMLTGLGIVWAVLALYAMMECAYRRELFWAPNWNSTIFPTGTLVTAMLQFSVAMDSPAFRGVTVGLIIIMIAVFLVNMAFAILRISQGKLLIIRDDPRVKAQMEGEQKSR